MSSFPNDYYEGWVTPAANRSGDNASATQNEVKTSTDSFHDPQAVKNDLPTGPRNEEDRTSPDKIPAFAQFLAIRILPLLENGWQWRWFLKCVKYIGIKANDRQKRVQKFKKTGDGPNGDPEGEPLRDRKTQRMIPVTGEAGNPVGNHEIWDFHSREMISVKGIVYYTPYSIRNEEGRLRQFADKLDFLTEILKMILTMGYFPHMPINGTVVFTKDQYDYFLKQQAKRKSRVGYCRKCHARFIGSFVKHLENKCTSDDASELLKRCRKVPSEPRKQKTKSRPEPETKPATHAGMFAALHVDNSSSEDESTWDTEWSDNTPVSAPKTEPAPEPAPEPASEPAPEPASEPAPEPAPEPEPETEPEPEPEPEPTIDDEIAQLKAKLAARREAQKAKERARREKYAEDHRKAEAARKNAEAEKAEARKKQQLAELERELAEIDNTPEKRLKKWTKLLRQIETLISRQESGEKLTDPQVAKISRKSETEAKISEAEAEIEQSRIEDEEWASNFVAPSSKRFEVAW